jgi:hypothetical protein
MLAAEALLGWARYTTAPFRLHLLPGGHLFYREQPDARAQVLRACRRMSRLFAPRSSSGVTSAKLLPRRSAGVAIYALTWSHAQRHPARVREIRRSAGWR